MASGTVAKLAAAVAPLLILIIIILPSVLPAGATRMVSLQVPENVVDENAPTTSAATTNLTFLPIRGGVVMMNNKTARRAEDDCDGLCTDEKCQQGHPDLCGPHEDPNYCWVGCYCTGYEYNFCTCLYTA